MKLHYDGHGLNNETGERVLTFARRPYQDGGGYLMESSQRETLGRDISNAFNNHADLVAALELVVEYHVPKINPLSDSAILSARAALAKAKGE